MTGRKDSHLTRDTMITVDFETEAIQPRPLYPPKPVGVAIRRQGEPAQYWSWGHPTENNCSKTDGIRALKAALAECKGVICHHIKFDADVAETHCGIKWPWGKSHDTMVLAFLNDPHSKVLGLKPLAERYLGDPPTEQEAVRDWLYANGVVRKGVKGWGAEISKAPGGLVGAYAIGDVDRTAALFDYFHPRIIDQGMTQAYAREMALLPILLDNERQGIRVDHELLSRDVVDYAQTLVRVDDHIRKYLKTPDLNIDSDRQFADALERAGLVKNWILTDKGHRSTAKTALQHVLEDKFLLGLLEYRSLLSTFHGTFMAPWLQMADATDGLIHTDWKSTAQEKGGGTRTGRLASSPNFQNIPSNDKLEESLAKMTHVFKKLKWLPQLPYIRNYIVADTKDHVLCGRDFSGQELRIAAHFEDDAMLAAYTDNPNVDLHQYGSDKIKEYTGLDLPRKKVKIIVFTILYGGGLGTIAERLETTVENAKKLRDAYFKVFPGIKALGREMQRRGANGEPMKTWGGRLYYVEPPKIIDGKKREFSYKLVNYLIQGSAADVTKEAMIRYHATRKDSRLLLTVHDELVISTPKKIWKREMETLRQAMDSIELDVPMFSDGEVGYRWQGMEEVE